ncbi:MAG: hemerythrin family protein [Rhodospirillaceae bacterium]
MNDDHVELYQIVGELSESVRQRVDGVYERDVLRLHQIAIVRKLIDKAAQHFRREEQLMEIYHFPETKAHRSEHLMLQRTVETSLSRLQAECHPVTEDGVKSLKAWLTNHIRTTDRKLDRFLIAAARKAGSAGAVKLAQGLPSWTPEHSLLWASFNDAVPTETVTDNRKKSIDTIQQMEDRQRRERERQVRESAIRRSAEEARRMRAVYFE